MAADDRINRLPGPFRPLARGILGAIRTGYRIRYPRLTYGHGVVILGRLKIQEGTRVVLGDRVRVRGRVTINGGGVVTVGADTLLNGCWIGGRSSVTIGAGCLISDCDITDSDFHNLEPSRRHEPPDERTRRPVHIGENVWVGAHAMVLKGSTVGANSVVGAGAVVRGEVPAGVVVVGNPAKVVKRLTSEGSSE
jgi:serine acetyltransferase